MRKTTLFVSLLAIAALSSACGGGGRGSATTALRTSGNFSGRIRIGGYSVHAQCGGRTETAVSTLLIEPGTGITYDDFSPLFAQFAKIAPWCAYVPSDTYPSDQRPAELRKLPDVEVNVDELHSVLAKAGVHPPFVFVAHSGGALAARLYAYKNPGDVAGMVLIDGYKEGWDAAMARLQEPEAPTKHDLRLEEPTVRLMRQTGDLRNIPIIVLTHGIGVLDARGERGWMHFQNDQAALSTNSVHVIATKSGHFIYRTTAEIVLEAIREVVRSASESSALPNCHENFPQLGGKCV